MWVGSPADRDARLRGPPGGQRVVTRTRVALGVVGVLLVASVGAGNAVVAGQRTVLDGEFVADQFAASEFYGSMEEGLEDRIEAAVGSAMGPEGGEGTPLDGTIDARELADEAVSRDYVEDRMEGNFRRVFAYLHGERAEPGVRMDLRPLETGIAEEVGRQIADVDVGDLAGRVAAEDEGDLPIDAELVGMMTENRSGYLAARAEFRDRVRAAVLDAAVDRAFRETGDDRLLALVVDGYDPREYTAAEKQRMVRDREPAIRAALRSHVEDERGADLERRVDAEVETRHEAARSRAVEAARDATSDRPRPVTDAVVDLNLAIVDGLMGDRDHGQFADRVADAKARLGEAAAGASRDRIDRAVPDSAGSDELLGNGTAARLASARGAVGTADLLAWLLPVIALCLVGLAYVPGRSVSTALGVVGTSLLVAGVGGFVGSPIARAVVDGRIRGALEGENADAVASALDALLDGALGTLATQSLVLTGVGVFLLGLYAASRAGYADGLVARVPRWS